MAPERGAGKSALGQKMPSRRSLPKTRTGCLTCKRRRVKCDEAKPACKRCLTFGVECDGYKPRPTTAEKALRKTLLPRVSPESQYLPGPSETLDTNPKDPGTSQAGIASEQGQILRPKDGYRDDCQFITLYRQPSTSFFDNEEEHRYFRFFSDNTVAHIAGCYNPLLWNRSVLQACEGERSILYAAIAIGALDLSFKTIRSPRSPDPKPIIQQVYSNEHYRFSLRQYSKAIKQMREATVHKGQDLRATLLASILIITFETYHGNYESALTQIRSSVQLLEDWSTTHPKSTDSSSSLSPSPHTIEDDLIHAFNRLEIEAIVYMDKEPLESHIFRKDDMAAAVENMPLEFENITDAQQFGKIVMRRLIHFSCMAWTYSKQTTGPPNINMYILDRIQVRDPDLRALAEWDKYKKELARWHSAFTPLLQKSVSAREKDKKERYPALCLQIHYLCVVIAMDCMFRTSETFFDGLKPIFTEVLSLAKILLSSSDSHAPFVFDSQVILPLEIMARKCRDPVLRREAIRLMLSMRRREGFTDSVLFAKICMWLVGVEEERMVGGRVPEEGRARDVCMELHEKGLHIWCKVPRIGGKLGEMDRREGIIK